MRITIALDDDLVAQVMTLIDRKSLFGRGIGYFDAHLLAATLLTPGARLWTRDKRLATAAGMPGIAARVRDGDLGPDEMME